LNENIILTIVELGVSILIEGILLTMVFNWISNKQQEKQQQNLQQEMKNLEKQNRYDFEQLLKAIHESKTELISQIKESSKDGEK
jgi:type II secretory pathway pseudopilin PulG